MNYPYLPGLTQTSYLHLPDGKMATIQLTRMALEPTGSTPYLLAQGVRCARAALVSHVVPRAESVANTHLHFIDYNSGGGGHGCGWVWVRAWRGGVQRASRPSGPTGRPNGVQTDLRPVVQLLLCGLVCGVNSKLCDLIASDNAQPKRNRTKAKPPRVS